ncbi:hypothetical protein DV736_g1486, partial [Chaetothyriales sp. CBS 134916]
MAILTYGSLLLGLVAIGLGSFVAVAIQRLYFHPLKNIPGPKLAAVTSAYEFYYDCILIGKLYFKINKLHDKYGPIVRISPREVHIRDPDFFDKVYNVTNKFSKDTFFYRFLDSNEGALATETAELHRIRRKPMNRFFSTEAIRRLSQPIMANVEKLCKRLDEFKQSGAPVNLSNAFRCFVTDNTTDYVLPHGYNMLDNEDFASDFNKQTKMFVIASLWHRYFPFILKVLMVTPREWLKLAPPGSLEAYDFQMGIIKQTLEVAKSGKHNDDNVAAGIFNSDLPESEKRPMRVVHDTRNLVGAGAETTATTLEMIFWKVSNDPAILNRLMDELNNAAESDGLTSFETLQKLPYLSAVVKEGLRRSISVSGRMPRFDPRNSLVYKEYVLPPRTIVSMDIPGVSLNPDVFPDPLNFDPERWLRPGERERSEKYFVPFGRGQRICVGKEFATVSIYLAVANLFHRYNFEWYQTTDHDLEMVHEMFAPFTGADSEGLRAYIR